MSPTEEQNKYTEYIFKVNFNCITITITTEKILNNQNIDIKLVPIRCTAILQNKIKS